ncbi:MAG TPA: hypothetical protein VKS21_11685, partial [Spirochaetota bacterium]|nr:hypothetical protein [Spirochaetota bacterium]
VNFPCDNMHYQRRHSLNGVVSIYDHGEQRFLRFNNFVQGRMHLQKQWKTIVPYMDIMCRSWERFMEQAPERIVHLGLGCGSGVRCLVKKYPGAKQTVFEYDTKLIRVIPKLFLLPSDVIILKGNAAKLDFSVPWKRWQWVLVDVFNGKGSSIIFSGQWFKKLAYFLADQALISVNFFSMKYKEWTELNSTAAGHGYKLVKKDDSLFANWVVNWVFRRNK